MPPLPLLDRRLIVVTGKGGTGKTTVSAALALAAAARGRRVLVAEVGLDEQLPDRLFGDGPGGQRGRSSRTVPFVPDLVVLRIDPYEALGEYLGLQLGLRALVRRVLDNRAFRQLMDASPGWRELITLGKLWHLEQQRDEAGRPRFDLLIVDAPATGHGLTFLDVPRVVGSAVRAGPLRRHAGLVEELVRDPLRSVVLPVTLAEELPAGETAELVARMRGEVGVAVDRVVVNAVEPDPFPPEVPDLAARLARLPADAAFPGTPSAATLAACAEHLRGRFLLHAHWTAVIGATTRLPLLALPRLRDGARAAADLLALGDALLAEPLERA